MDRQKFSVAGSKAALDSDAKLSAVGVPDGGEVLVKDLGPQIGWKTVFLIEYVSMPSCLTHSYPVAAQLPRLTRYRKGWTLVHPPSILSPAKIILRPRCAT